MISILYDGTTTMCISVNPPKKEQFSKMGLTITNYFVTLTLSLTLFLVERGSSIGTIDFFFLALACFFSVVVLSLADGFSSSMVASTNTCNFFGLPHLESASTQPLVSYSETESLCFSYKDSLTVYEGARPFLLQTLPSQGCDCSHP